MLSQVDSDGFTMTMMEGIVDHKIDTEVAVTKNDMYVVICCGQKRKKNNMRLETLGLLEGWG